MKLAGHSHLRMRVVTFMVAWAVVTSFRSATAAPTSASSPCQTDFECEEGEFCDEKSGSFACTPCLDCGTDYNRVPPGLDNCAKNVTECGDCLDGFSGHDCETESEEGIQVPALPPSSKIPPDDKTGPKSPSDEKTDGEVSSYIWIAVVTCGVLAASVVAVVCVFGRRPWQFTQGGSQPKRQRSGEEEASAHFHRDGRDQAGIDGGVEFYGQSERQPVGDEDNVLEALLENAIDVPPESPVEAQQPLDPDAPVNEDSILLDPHGTEAQLPQDNIPEEENSNGRDLRNNIEEAAVPEERAEDDARLQNDSGTHSEEEQHERAGDESHVPDVNALENESGIGIDNLEDQAEHQVPQLPLSPAIPTSTTATNNPLAGSSDSYAQRLQTLNLNLTEIARREEEERRMNYEALPDFVIVKHKH